MKARKTPSQKTEQEEKLLLIRLPKELHRELRLLAYDLNVSMAELCREGLVVVMQKYQNRKKK